jgi:hypothetical protein
MPDEQEMGQPGWVPLTKSEREERRVKFLIAGIAAFAVAACLGIAYVAFHFIAKFW